MTNSHSKHSRNEVFNNDTLRQAVSLWFFNRGEAIRQHGHISTWNTSEVTNMMGLFNGAHNFDEDIGSWDVSKVINMSLMFCKAEKFNQYIGNWDVGNVTNMRMMFCGAIKFNQYIGSWDVSNVTDMSWMFRGIPISTNDMISVYTNGFIDTSIRERTMSFNQSIGNWDVGNVITMYGMFEFALLFDSCLEDWDVRKVIDMSYMFNHAFSFNSDISKWQIDNVTNTRSMFGYAYKFNQDVSEWNVSNVVFMMGMFQNALSFEQDISKWNIDVTNVQNPFTDVFSNFYNIIKGSALDRKLNGESCFNKVVMKKLFQYKRRKDFLMFLVQSGYMPYQGTYQHDIYHKIYSNEDMCRSIMSFI